MGAGFESESDVEAAQQGFSNESDIETTVFGGSNGGFSFDLRFFFGFFS